MLRSTIPPSPTSSFLKVKANLSAPAPAKPAPPLLARSGEPTRVLIRTPPSPRRLRSLPPRTSGRSPRRPPLRACRRRSGASRPRRAPGTAARLDRDAIHEPADRAGVTKRVVAEDRGFAAVVDQQGRQQADQRRFARAVLTQDRHAFAALDPERHALQRRPAAPREQAGAPVA